MGNEDAKPLSADKIREKIADYRRSAEAARRKADETPLPQVRKRSPVASSAPGALGLQ
jgi:hypothetical protein